ncbi:deoxyribose-phosphate aldolase [Pectinatus brassicae]|uniref:Deoxyribose-phosphate aldolase n=1 Tax=Pectinatus brassicae TaxID=862415 RepID=A0A840UTS4_9FIRM|nr:deoxyribose-phosphate aldolase [Pectinatus brassicae]MBB5336224.1 deoxyribose-phosphate aldolase [Pectinatus brassicae]
MKMDEILKHVDHTLLKADAAWTEIEQLCDEAVEYKTASVCIPPSYVQRVKEKYGDKLTICTVIGFPLGYACTGAKIAEAKQAIDDGAVEIDMVINLGDVKNNDYEKITAEIKAIKKNIGEKILKVIIETCYLEEQEKIKLCQCVTEGNADYIKTSTGFGSAGAKIEDIKLFKQYIGENVKIKAAGGIHSKEEFTAFLQAGCTRIGASSAVKLIKPLYK